MLTIRTTAAALLLLGLSAGSALAATCSLTVLGALVVDDQDCTLVQARRSARVVVPTYGTISIRGTTMSARTLVETARGGRRVLVTRLGSVVTSPDVEDKTCFSGQVATLCVE